MDIYSSVQNIQQNLLEWFSKHGRFWIPWKLNQDGSLPKPAESISPYGIWIAEVMLQQTKVKVVVPYWKKWIQTFPDLHNLASADEQDVLLQWQGLGYYARAKRIHHSSKLLLKYVGKQNSSNPESWPVEIDQWISLPGIGRSTAGSIISSAFDLPAPILDGNVKRILIRLIASKKPSNRDTKRLWELSSLLLSRKSPRNFNQALMDLGSKVCTSQNPRCSYCPLQNDCLAKIKYDPNNFPAKIMNRPKPIEEIGLGIIFNKSGELLIDQRLDSSRMGGMWEFPGGKKESDESIEKTIEREINEELGIFIKVGEKLLSFEHSYSHKRLRFTVHLCEWKAGIPKPLASQKLLWVSPDKLFDYPFPAANSKIISELHKHLSIGNKKTINS